MAFQDALMVTFQDGHEIRTLVSIYALTAEQLEHGLFLCPHCGVRVYVVLPIERKPHFAANGTDSHRPGCTYYNGPPIQRVAHLDHTGQGFDLQGFILQPQPDKRRWKPDFPPRNGEDDDGLHTVVLDEKKHIERVKTHPHNLIQLYGVLKTPGIREYAGYRVVDILVDHSTIHYHRRHSLHGIALAVCGLCHPPAEIISKIRSVENANCCMCLRAPYMHGNAKDIYYVLKFASPDKLTLAYELIRKHNKTKKYLVMANWKPLFSTSAADVYIGNIYNTKMFAPLLPKDDYDLQ